MEANTPDTGRSEASPEPLAVTVDGARRVLPVGRTMLYELIACGEIPTFTVGTRRLIPVAGLRDFIARRLAAEQSGDRSDAA